MNILGVLLTLASCLLPSYYQIDETLGAGQSGEVYLVHDPKHHRLAVKHDHGANYFLNSTPAKREYLNAQKLQHLPSVRKIYEEINGNLLVMEYIEGSPVRQLEGDLRQQYIDMINAVLDEGMIPIDVHCNNMLVEERTGRLRLIDLAYFLDIYEDIDHVFNPEELYLYRNEERPVTPQHATYLAADDLRVNLNPDAPPPNADDFQGNARELHQAYRAYFNTLT